MEKNYKSKFETFANKLKTEAPKIPIQEVNPIVPKAVKEEEGQLVAWIPKQLLKRVKSFGVENELSIKDITTKALEQYLSTKTNT